VKKQSIIELTNISKTFKIREHKLNTIRDFATNFLSKKNSSTKTIHALKNINITIREGESLGIIGRNGSGKSTLLNIMMESIAPDKGGKIETQGRMIRLSLGLGVDPNLSARDNIYVNGSLIGLTFDKIGNIFNDILVFADLQEFVDTPVKFYSKGMKQRLLFSIAIHAEADVILLDEFFGGTGDKQFRKKSDQAFKMKILEGKTIVIVSHSMNIINKYCTRTIWIDKGHIVAEGKTVDIVKLYSSEFKSLKNVR